MNMEKKIKVFSDYEISSNAHPQKTFLILDPVLVMMVDVVDLTVATENDYNSVRCIDLTGSDTVDNGLSIANVKLRSKRVSYKLSNSNIHCNSFEEDLQIVTGELKGLSEMKIMSNKFSLKKSPNKKTKIPRLFITSIV
mmetsp:Transcript_13896/g.18880  ORF Transcript_13896/g.18880 Transcript_13896/m.18880 type:complete len:139 (-) Transcript_13896:1664-2080(-)